MKYLYFCRNICDMNILFICLGNICRSSAAEEVMRQQVLKAGLGKKIKLDSAGLIDYHEGELSDPRMSRHAQRRGYHLTHLSRPIRRQDFDKFDWIIGMDENNIRQLQRLAPSAEAQGKIRRMTDFCQKYQVDTVPDPYYGGDQDFEYVLDVLEDACEGLLQEIRKDL